MCSQWTATFHSQEILESCYPKVLWNLRGSVWQLPFKANASYWWKWWRMISRCLNACFGNCYRKLKYGARTTERDVKYWSKRDWTHTKQDVQNSERIFRACTWVKRAVIRAAGVAWSERRWASMLVCTQAHYITAVCSTFLYYLVIFPITANVTIVTRENMPG